MISSKITLSKAIISNLFGKTSKYNIFMQNWLIDRLIYFTRSIFILAKLVTTPLFFYLIKEKRKQINSKGGKDQTI